MITATIITIKDKTEIITQKDHVTTVESSDISQEIVERAKIITTIIIEIITDKTMQKTPK